MTLNELRENLQFDDSVRFKLPDGNMVPAQFHVTEIGKVQRDFIDCGGRISSESFINMQLWDSNDFDHRLESKKLLKIIDQSERALNLKNFPVEVEYQGGTIGRYDLSYDGTYFHLIAKQTDCRAKDKCRIPEESTSSVDASTHPPAQCCSPVAGCCA